MNKCYELLEQYTILYNNSLENNIKPRKNFKILNNKSYQYYKKLSKEILIAIEIIKKIR
tara:strand:+ start:5375 stop:5551 length:177 start_codon:yes stop_codon:yes gene_type:complete